MLFSRVQLPFYPKQLSLKVESQGLLSSASVGQKVLEKSSGTITFLSARSTHSGIAASVTGECLLILEPPNILYFLCNILYPLNKEVFWPSTEETEGQTAGEP